MRNILMRWTRTTRVAIYAGGFFLASSWLFILFNLTFPVTSQLDWGDNALWGINAGALLLLIIAVATLAFFTYLSLTWSAADATLLFVLSVGISTLAELASLDNGILFGGTYRYHAALEPRIAGTLPLAIPLAWFVLSCIPLTLLRHWLRTLDRPGVGNAMFRQEKPRTRWKTLWFRVSVCALLLAAMDLFIEPLSVYTGLWAWEQPGSYLGAPVANILGWTIVGLVIYGVFFSIRDRLRYRPPRPTRKLDLLVLGLFVIWVNVALIMIGTVLDNLLPAWLTIAILGPTTLFWAHRNFRQTRAQLAYRTTKATD